MSEKCEYKGCDKFLDENKCSLNLPTENCRIKRAYESGIKQETRKPVQIKCTNCGHEFVVKKYKRGERPKAVGSDGANRCAHDYVKVSGKNIVCMLCGAVVTPRSSL